MKIAIIGKRDIMGTTPSIRLKGMSRITYPFLWDKENKRYAYTPKNQREVEDIFRTQGKVYRHMFFIPIMDEKEDCPACAKPEPEEKPAKRKPGRPRKKPSSDLKPATF
jgi:hypothetical protein